MARRCEFLAGCGHIIIYAHIMGSTVASAAKWVGDWVVPTQQFSVYKNDEYELGRNVRSFSIEKQAQGHDTSSHVSNHNPFILFSQNADIYDVS